jgi:hypothetical protein
MSSGKSSNISIAGCNVGKDGFWRCQSATLANSTAQNGTASGESQLESDDDVFIPGASDFAGESMRSDRLSELSRNSLAKTDTHKSLVVSRFSHCAPP